MRLDVRHIAGAYSSTSYTLSEDDVNLNYLDLHQWLQRHDLSVQQPVTVNGRTFKKLRQ